MLNIHIAKFVSGVPLAVFLVIGGTGPLAHAGGGEGVGYASEYDEVLGAGGLRFDFIMDELWQPPASSPGTLLEIRDMNSDGLDDFLFGFHPFDNYIHYALGELGSDGSMGYVLYEFPTPSIYDAVVAGDLDGNGWADIVTRTYGHDTLAIGWVENGEVVNETFESHVNMRYDEGSSPYEGARVTIQSGDLDGDGLADLVMNTTRDTIVVRWSSRPVNTEYTTYGVPYLSTQNVMYPLRDYDGDSILDVLLLDIDTERFILLRGTGFDTLMVPEVVGVSVSGYVGNLDYPEFGRFDSNPAVDLVLHDDANGRTVIIPNFALGIDPAVVLPLSDDERVVSVPGDVDLSGFDDLVVVGPDILSNSPGLIEEVSLLFDPLSVGSSRLGIETGNTPFPYLLSFNGGPRVPVCVAVNLDADADQELLWTGDVTGHKVQNGISGDYVYGFMIRASSQRADMGKLPRFGASQFEGQKIPLHMLPIDLDQDGIDELFMVGASTRGRIVDVDEGSVANVPGVNNGFMSAAADLGGDGSPEIVVVRVQNSLVVLPVMGDGTTGPRILFANPNGNDYGGVVSADFNNDGKDDLVAIDQVSREIHLWRGIGDAQIELTSTLSLPGTSTVRPGVIDIDMDGYMDLVIGGGNGYRFYINQQDGTFLEGNTIDGLIDGYWIITEDIDLDGNIDIVSANLNLGTLSGGISVHFMGQDGVVETVRYLFYLANAAVNEVVAGDFNGDGLLDLVGSIGQGSGNGHLVWIQTPGRGFEVHAVLPASGSATVGMSDLNLDGALDVITASNLDDSVRVHWGTPTGCGADLNGDGDLNFLDISEFLSTQLDFNGDGSFNFLDISGYLAAFGAGCP